MSPTQRWFGTEAVKSRLSRSGSFGAVLSCRVKPLGRLKTTRATRPCRRIESATVLTDTRLGLTGDGLPSLASVFQ